MTPRDIAARVTLALVVAGGVCFGARAVYFKPRQERIARLDALGGQIAKHEKTLQGAPELRARAKVAGESLIGIDHDEVNARFRDGLARVAEQCGLTGVTVEAGGARDETNPLVNVRADVPMTLKRELRRKPDFAILQGTVKGTGSLEQTLRLIAYLESQTWVHRVEEISLRPTGRNRERFEVRVVAETILAPDLARLAGPKGPEPSIALASGKVEESIREMVRKNVFVRPTAIAGQAKPSVVVVAQTPEQAPTLVFPPYEDWKLTGVALGRAGSEALFVNVRTGEKITLQRGGALLDAIFLEGKGETAVIEIGGKRFEISNGQTLASRRPLG